MSGSVEHSSDLENVNHFPRMVGQVANRKSSDLFPRDQATITIRTDEVRPISGILSEKFNCTIEPDRVGILARLRGMERRAAHREIVGCHLPRSGTSRSHDRAELFAAHAPSSLRIVDSASDFRHVFRVAGEFDHFETPCEFLALRGRPAFHFCKNFCEAHAGRMPAARVIAKSF